MDLPVRPETVLFSLLVVVLAWWLVDLPPVERALVAAGALAVYLAAGAAIERLRRRYLGEYPEP